MTLAIAGVWSPVATAEETLLGAAFRHRPAYDGADEFRTDAVPVVRFSHGNGFARTTQGVLEAGARIRMGNVHAGLQVAHEAGPRDEAAGFSAGVHVEWESTIGPAPVTVLARARNHLHAEQGGAFDARVTIGVLEARGVRAGLYGQGTWTDREHQRAHYSVDRAGFLHGSVGVVGSYAIGKNLIALAGAEARRLTDALSRSEFVNEKTSHSLNVGLAYRF